MIEDIEFLDTDEKVSVTIDNETQEIPIQKIKKFKTYIDLNQTLDTALKNNIILDASIYYRKDIEDNYVENEEFLTDDIYLSEANRIISTDGTVTITIYNDKEVYYSQNVHFTKGHILDDIVNRLPLGEYKCVIEYAGNKYFQPSTLEVLFLIEKRLAKCTIEKDYYYGDLQERVVINGILTDNETERPIYNCTVTYEFDGETFDTRTDGKGTFSLDKIVIPEADYKHCAALYEGDETEADFEPGDLYEEEAEEAYIDEDGNIRLLSDAEKAIYESERIYDETGREITIDAEGNIKDKATNETLYNIDTETDDSKKVFFDINGRLLTIDDSGNMVYVSVDIDDTTGYDNVDYPEDPNIEESYPNVSYLVTVTVDDESYYLEAAEVEVIVNKADTNISISSTNIDTPSNTVTLIGKVIASFLDIDEGVKYGKVNISFPEFNYNYNEIDINNGGFEAEINLNDVYDSYNQSDIVDLVPYNTVSTVDTDIEVSGDLYDGTNDSIISVGDFFTIEAKVKSIISDEYISDGMLTFILEDPDASDDDKKILYRYSTQIDTTGAGTFTFNTSRAKTYNVYVKYIGMFGYQDKTSNKYEVRVE